MSHSALSQLHEGEPTLKKVGNLSGDTMKYTKASGSLPLTKIRIASLAELPTTPEAEIKGLFICLPQLVATLDGCKCLLSIAVSDEAVVVTGEEDEARLGCLSEYMPWRRDNSQGTEGLGWFFSFPKWPTL